MRRLAWFLGSLVLLAWLAGPQSLAGAAAPASVAIVSAPQGEETYLACDGRWCVPVAGCEPNQCANDQDCGGCNDEVRSACPPEVGSWNEGTCSCDPLPCDPSEKQHCTDQWGTWHEGSCSCSNECTPAEPWLVSSEWTNELLWCTGCYWGRYVTREIYNYEQYCQDGRYIGGWTYVSDFYYDDFSWECAGECWAW